MSVYMAFKRGDKICAKGKEWCSTRDGMPCGFIDTEEQGLPFEKIVRPGTRELLGKNDALLARYPAGDWGVSDKGVTE